MARKKDTHVGCRAARRYGVVAVHGTNIRIHKLAARKSPIVVPTSAWPWGYRHGAPRPRGPLDASTSAREKRIPSPRVVAGVKLIASYPRATPERG